MKSLWQGTVQLPKFPKLQGDAKTDVLIIGGGITGILCAYMLKNLRVDYMLVEAEEICGGVTGNTTAKITSQHGAVFSKLIKEFGVEKAEMYLRANEEAIKEYESLCKNIDCDFMKESAYLYSCESIVPLEAEWNALEKIGYKADFERNLKLPFSTIGGIKFSNQAQFNPLKFISAIVKDLNIYEGTKVTEWNGKEFITAQGKIRAKKTIIATHFPIINKHGKYFLKMYQQRSYVLALENAATVDGMYIDEKADGLSLRNADGMLLLGGGTHRTGKQGGGFGELSAAAHRHFRKSKEKYRWATQDCITLDGIPYIGEYSNSTNGLYVATGFNKWGMTSSMVAAQLLKDMILEKYNPYISLFNPSRSILRPQLCLNAIETVTNLLKFKKPRCPHLGCALTWNKEEHSWDCPCHGSRFRENGELIENPATDDLKV